MFRSSIGHRSDMQKQEDERFMQALREISTLEAKDGRLSMGAADLQEQVETLHKAGKRLVDQQD
ncbi:MULTISPECIES: hypothetical protein [Pseudomonas]|uniref:Uncharacterized protein n=1 Tax=Pseudomonas capeferrum TaxID=1495066 RepID=A0ABY7R2K2_9PSED|nr:MULTISPECIES: hypothetical protein [Pseudomonas]KGI92881.1 hypothetical protein MD26_12405 [Pseudomonas sp. H2]MUT49740.1 hypothetical protein [Pseudomonas sp. TDA1]WCH97981.1 hypothetical protein PMC74_14420 [Pseudomonas capeferrum]